MAAMFHNNDIPFPANDYLIGTYGTFQRIVGRLRVPVFLRGVKHREASSHLWGVQTGNSAEMNPAQSDSMTVLGGTSVDPAGEAETRKVVEERDCNGME